MGVGTAGAGHRALLSPPCLTLGRDLAWSAPGAPATVGALPPTACPAGSALCGEGVFPVSPQSHAGIRNVQKRLWFGSFAEASPSEAPWRAAPRAGLPRPAPGRAAASAFASRETSSDSRRCVRGLSLACAHVGVPRVVRKHRQRSPYPGDRAVNPPSKEQPLPGAQGTSQALKEGSLEQAALGAEP